MTSFVKDAAKAVERITQAEFTAVADNTLTELLGIETLFVTMYALRREGDEDVLHLRCAHREEVALCTHCGTLSTNVHQEESRCVRHLYVCGNPEDAIAYIEIIGRMNWANEGFMLWGGKQDGL